MKIISTNQYNQGISKSKLLSSTSGVGSIFTTKAGYYILVSDINKWKFISSSQREISRVREDFIQSEWYEKSKKRLASLGVSVVDDSRFIEFLKTEKQLNNLLCLVDIPHLSINEHFNTVNVSNNPTIKELREQGETVSIDDFMVFGSHFPKWFRNKKGRLQTYNSWKERWHDRNLRAKFFAPPRDADDPVLGSNRRPLPPLKVRDQDGVEEEVQLFHELTQINLIMICPNGHLSDIPWSKFLKWKSERRSPEDRGEELLISNSHCCPNPNLKWSENTNKSEGYGSIYIECETCHTKENLEGINNLTPFCLGEKPWELDLGNNNSLTPRDQQCQNIQGGRQRMQVSLVTGNSVYFANGFSSIFIPKFLADGVDEQAASIIKNYDKKYERYLEFEKDISRNDFFEKMMTPEKLLNDGYLEGTQNIQEFHKQLKNLFLKEEEEVDDPHEHYKWQEYHCFRDNEVSPASLNGLSFKDISLPKSLESYFEKIQQVEELKITQVQLDFTRQKPNERIRRDGNIINTTDGQNIFSVEPNDLYTLPANETYGEGLFFGFDNRTISEWYNHSKNMISHRLSELIGNYDENSQGEAVRQRILSDGLNGAKFLLIHTFAHALMRELEFSCGYPTASLKERLYVSSRMSGVLIYTAEGSEGSMGGLVWQGQPEKIENLIVKSMLRAADCSSDPLCWESGGQGIFNLNLAACFSCSLVSETACEERNIGLDRRILVDSDFGFFKNIHA